MAVPWEGDDWDDDAVVARPRAGPRPAPPWLPAPISTPVSAWEAPNTVIPTFPMRPSGYTPPQDTEGRCVEQLARVAFTLDRWRYEHEVPLREVAAKAGLPLGSVVSFFGGKVWPHPRTLGRLCATSGVRWAFTSDPHRRVGMSLTSRNRFRRGPDRGAIEATAGSAPDALAAAWHNIAIAHLRWYVAAADVTGRQLARVLGMREATWAEAKPVAPDRWTSTRVMLAVADVIGHRIELDERERAWPWVEWKTTHAT